MNDLQKNLDSVLSFIFSQVKQVNYIFNNVLTLEPYKCLDQPWLDLDTERNVLFHKNNTMELYRKLKPILRSIKGPAQNLVVENGCSEGAQEFAIDALSALSTQQEYRNRMSDDEISLFETLTDWERLQYLTSAYQAETKMEELFSTPCERYNGKGDAFRHAYWNALSSSRLGVGLTNQLTTRHENRPPQYPYHSKENQMDLHNNSIGRDIVFNGSCNILADVLEALNNGDLKYLNNQDSFCRAKYSSQLIPTNQ